MSILVDGVVKQTSTSVSISYHLEYGRPEERKSHNPRHGERRGEELRRGEYFGEREIRGASDAVTCAG
jgi:hypothetical protein